jgi:hypothetical protein
MAHENLAREQRVEGSSDRTFGFVFAAVFAVVAGWPVASGGAPRWWAAALAVAFALVAIVKPGLLAGLNRWWMKLGLLLGAIVSPIALGVLFYAVFTPIGFVIRLTGGDPLRLARDTTAASYWRGREPPGPPPQSMDRQF